MSSPRADRRSPSRSGARPAGRSPVRESRASGAGGFTLVELVIVTVLLGILAMIAVPIYQGFRRNAARSALRQQLRTLAQAEQMYFLEHDVYTDDVEDLDYRPARDLQLEMRVASGGGGGGPPGGGPAGPPGGGPFGGGPPGGSSPGRGPPPWAGPGGGAGAQPGWSARLTDPDYGVRCAVFHGSATPFDPATVEGEIACDEEG